MKLAPRLCLVCRRAFKPESPTDWWCSTTCKHELEDRERARAVEAAEIRDALESPEASEAEKARASIIDRSSAVTRTTYPEALVAVSHLASLARAVSGVQDAYLVLLTARGFLDQALAYLEETGEIGVDDGDVSDPDDPAGGK